jgi:hypothetical protein
MEERILMKWFQNPFSNHSRWQLKRAWWQLVAPGLIKENREWAQMVDRRWDDLEKRDEEIDELKKEVHENRYFWSRMQDGYWHIHIGDGVSSVSRIDEKFIKWYETWITPVQEEFVFEYERPELAREYEKRIQTYEEEYDERYY